MPKLAALESVRGFVAFYVFIHHAHLLPNVGVGRLLYFGQEAVVVFFVLSGFVISYSTRGATTEIGHYVFARARRIYPIFVVALGLAYVAACVEAKSLVPVDAPQLFGNLFMMQDVSALKPGVLVDTYQGNSPLWSLSYEWWFYMAFVPLAMTSWIAPNSRLRVVAGISLLGSLAYMASPSQVWLFASYLLIWWAGVEMCREYAASGRVTFSGQMWSLAMLLLVLGCWLGNALLRYDGGIQIGVYPFLPARHFLAATFVVAAVVVLPWRLLERCAALLKPFAALAPVSYFLYVAHQPVLKAASHVVPTATPPLIIALLAFVVTLVLGWVVEVRMQHVINRFSSVPRRIATAMG